MEVHHSHHKAHEKKIKEYFLEFFMLFLAVTLGFLAENLRENYVEKEREHQYMESFVLDLEKDLINLQKAIPALEDRIAAIDSVFVYFKFHPNAKSLPVSVQSHIKRANWNFLAYRNVATISQLKNAGGFRLVRNRLVADSIALYDMRWTRIEAAYERYYISQHDIYTLEEQMLNAYDAIDAYILNNKGFDNQNNIPNSTEVRFDATPLSQYLNILARQQTVTAQDMRSYNFALIMTKNLITLIKKEYKLH
ncbi:MAG: hypothetical protein EBX50_06235 [Chitinophagia bacterium]|nr:hypothetical protein [Chitinophagia bacterium]